MYPKNEIIEKKSPITVLIIPVAGEQLQLTAGRAHVIVVLTGDQAGCRAFGTGFVRHV